MRSKSFGVLWQYVVAVTAGIIAGVALAYGVSGLMAIPQNWWKVWGLLGLVISVAAETILLKVAAERALFLKRADNFLSTFLIYVMAAGGSFFWWLAVAEEPLLLRLTLSQQT